MGGYILQKTSNKTLKYYIKDNIVFIVSMAISSLLVIWGVIDGSGFTEIANKIYLFLENNFRRKKIHIELPT